MGLVFFKINKHKRFNYKPLYYDPKKEEIEELKKRAATKDEANLEEMRGKIRSRWQQHRTTNANKYSFLRIAFVLFILFVIVYFLLK